MYTRDERVLKEVERMVSDFLWDGKGVRIAREVMENEYEDVKKQQRPLLLVERSEKAYSTWYSQAVSHPSTNQARPCLASEIGRDRACSGWYGPSLKGLFVPCLSGLRPYHPEHARSRPISEAKQGRAWLVLGWETAWEYQVL
ncbi:hypothetical protein L3Q82_023673 [Scortum barcoo]|uniref:Uncharacterized protein n=1 Tax=Scortum barcoo TaxID=214431 RepID=A0ACB8WUN9_9TELE|nr:hypothetical protein L3Q82_023673 [Scortum barcoo]